MAKTLEEFLLGAPPIPVEPVDGGSGEWVILQPDGNAVLHPPSAVLPCIRGAGFQDDPYYTPGVGSDHLKIIRLWWELRPKGTVWICAGGFRFQINKRGVRSEHDRFTQLG